MMNFRKYSSMTSCIIPNKVILTNSNFSSAFSYMTNLKTSQIPVNKVTNMGSAYYMCRNLTGSPVCGGNVTSMTSAYYYC